MRLFPTPCSDTIASGSPGRRLDRAAVEVSIGSGPDCTGRISLARGRHVIGRSPTAHIRIADPRLGLHHAVLDVGVDAVTVTQLSGQAPIRLDDEPVAGTQTVSLPARLSIGMNELLIGVPLPVAEVADGADRAKRAVGNVVPSPNDPWRRIVYRGPDRAIEPAPDPITVPGTVQVQRTPPVTALIGAAVAALGAGAIAVLSGQMLLARFAAFGAVASTGIWLLGAASAVRRNRRSRRVGVIDRQRFLDDLAAARVIARQRHIAEHAGLGEIIAIADALAGSLPLRSDVWRRLAGIGTCVVGAADPRNRAVFEPVIGRGTSRWTPALDGEVGPESVTDVDCAAMIDDVPIPLALACGDALAISGGLTERTALVRSIVCQMAVRHGPADWQLIIVSPDRREWRWAGSLPHARSSTGAVLIAQSGNPEELETVLTLADGVASRPTLLVVDDPALLDAHTSVLRRFIERVQPATLTTIDAGASIPAVCGAVIEVGSTGAVMTTRLDGSTGGLAEAASSITMCGLSRERAAGIARSIARLVDPDLELGPVPDQSRGESPSSQRGPRPY